MASERSAVVPAASGDPLLHIIQFNRLWYPTVILYGIIQRPDHPGEPGIRQSLHVAISAERQHRNEYRAGDQFTAGGVNIMQHITCKVNLHQLCRLVDEMHHSMVEPDMILKQITEPGILKPGRIFLNVTLPKAADGLHRYA